MYSLRCALVLSVLAAIAYGKVVNVKNRRSTAIAVSGGDADYTVASNGYVSIDSDVVLLEHPKLSKPQLFNIELQIECFTVSVTF